MEPKCTFKQLVEILEIILKAFGYAGQIKKLTIRPVGTNSLITFENN